MTNGFAARNARALMWGTALAALATPSLAWAQATPSSATDTASADDENAIIITAQRRNERLEDVPKTVSAVNADTLANAGVGNLRDISRVVTGFQLGTNGAFPAPAVRGVTTLPAGTSFENNIAVYIDGFYEVAPQSLNIDLPNVENIQVLKGPQGTLYGRNATGGAVLLNTIIPGDEWRGKAELTYARFDDMRIGGYFAGPLNNWIGLSVAAYTRRSDGYIRLTSRTTPGALDGNATPLTQDTFRAKLKFDLSDSFRAIVGYNFIHTDDPRANSFSPFENVSRTYLLFPFSNSTRPTELGTGAWDIDSRIETWTHQANLTLEWDTGIGKLKSYTGYQSMKPITSFDFDGSYANLSWSTSVFRQKTFQQAVDFSIDTIKNVDLIMGGTYFRDKLKTLPPNIANYSGLNPADPGTTPPDFSTLGQIEDRIFTQDKEAWAIYLDATWNVTDKLHINVGGRYSAETQDVFAQSRCFIVSVTTSRDVCRAITPDANGNRFIFPATNKSSSYKKFTPSASIRYEIAPRTNVYASYSQGFHSGAWNASLPTFLVGPSCPAAPAAIVAPCPQPGATASGPDFWVDAKQEEITAYEVGFKTAGHNFHAEISAFLYDYKNLQVNFTSCVGGPPCAITAILGNAPKAKIKGIEGSFEYKPVENLTLRGGATWLHARYGKGFIFSGVGVVAPTAAGGPATTPATLAGINTNSDPLKTYLNQNQLQDLSGLRMSRAPDFTANFGATYEIPIGEGGILLAGNANYTSKYVVTNPSIWCQPLAANNNCGGIPADRQHQQRFMEGSYVLLSASITYTEPSGHFYTRIWGNNLNNHKYRLHYTGTSGFGTYSPMAEPRTYGVTAGFKF